jgi:ABC-type multidrug transport system permease subunit
MMMSNLQAQARIVWALVQRDLFLLRQSLYDDLLNSFVKVTALYFVLGVLSPYLGFRDAMSRDVMIGAIVSVLLSRGFVSAVSDSFDMTDNRFIDYKRTLPLSTAGMLCASLLGYVVVLAVSTLPLFFLAKFYLGAAMPLGSIQWIPLIIIYLLGMVFVSAFFLSVIFCASFEWFQFNIWQRVLTPMNTFGCLFFSWYHLYAFSPLLARALLINPFTYISEGLRASIFGNADYIPVYYCMPVLAAWTAVALCVLLVYVRKKVDTQS